jgi:hypothetical protein
VTYRVGETRLYKNHEGEKLLGADNRDGSVFCAELVENDKPRDAKIVTREDFNEMLFRRGMKFDNDTEFIFDGTEFIRKQPPFH